jgi:predicted GIY-YIG superfamily endonuclease
MSELRRVNRTAERIKDNVLKIKIIIIAGSSNGRTAAFCAKGASASGGGANYMNYQTYILKSNKDNIRYIGSGQDAQKRLHRHNRGDYRFTKGHRPWSLIYLENFKTHSEAMAREKFLKSGQGRKWLDEQGIK